MRLLRSSLALLFPPSLAAAAACGQNVIVTQAPPAPEPSPEPAFWAASGDMLGDLPKAEGSFSKRFLGAVECAFCHATDPASPALKDSKGRDVSPYNMWKATMMGMSTRDPYYLAAFRHELDAHPAATKTIEATCTRCHAPMGSVERAEANSEVHYADLLGGNANEAVLAREGVSCTLCHQIKPDNLGKRESFTGGFVVGDERKIFGPHENPFVVPMQNHVSYTPTHAPHMETSELCATCHTVITRALDASGAPVGPEFPEQTPYLEWLSSIYADASSSTGRTCQSCHMPALDDDEQPIDAPLAMRPPGMKARRLKGRHLFRGGNAFMLRMLAANAAWSGTVATPEELTTQAERDEAMLGRAGSVRVTDVSREGANLVVRVSVSNESGHKLPTGFPSRRAWVHVTVTAPDGKVVFESGRMDDYGRIVDMAGRALDAAGAPMPHRDVISADTEVQVYEAVMADATGAPAKTLFDATHFSKDNRLLPRGFRADAPSAAMIRPVGVEGDPDFGSTDGITYRVAGAPAGSTVAAELVYQSIRPRELDNLAEHPSPAAIRLFSMVKGATKRASIVSRAEASAP